MDGRSQNDDPCVNIVDDLTAPPVLTVRHRLNPLVCMCVNTPDSTLSENETCMALGKAMRGIHDTVVFARTEFPLPDRYEFSVFGILMDGTGSVPLL